MIRFLFWFKGFLIVLGVALGVGIFVTSRDSSSGTGMAFILFLPLGALTIIAGGASTVIGFRRR